MKVSWKTLGMGKVSGWKQNRLTRGGNMDTHGARDTGWRRGARRGNRHATPRTESRARTGAGQTCREQAGTPAVRLAHFVRALTGGAEPGVGVRSSWDLPCLRGSAALTSCNLLIERCVHAGGL